MFLSMRSEFQLTRPVWGEPQQVEHEPQHRPFQLTRPVWGEPIHEGQSLRRVGFQLTRPVWGEPYFRQDGEVYCEISTHSPRVGRTVMDRNTVSHFSDFNSLAPCGANQNIVWSNNCLPQFQLTRPVWGEPLIFFVVVAVRVISTHSPRVGRTPSLLIAEGLSIQFQLTRPVWGEPLSSLLRLNARLISTHSPRVGRTQHTPIMKPCSVAISTHSPRVGRTSNF